MAVVKRQSILDFFPGSPREVQKAALLKLEELWDRSDVLMFEAPTGFGKTLCAITIARWASSIHKKKTSILTPTKILVDQYLETMPKLHTIRNMDSYMCTLYENQAQKQSCKKSRQLSEDGKFCSGCCYMKEVRKGHVMPYGVYNNWSYLAHKLYRDILILDEGHTAIDMLRELACKKLWYRDYKFPSKVKDYRSLLRWVETNPRLNTDAKLQLLLKELTGGKVHYLVQRTTDLLRGEEEEVLKLLPVDVRDAPPTMWPVGKVKKLVFLSATISRKDLEMMGLDRRRIGIIHGESPIPVNRRPVFYTPCGNYSATTQDRDLPRLVDAIKELLKQNPTAGMIHAPYSLAQKLAEALADEPRILSHTQENKSAQYKRFREEGPTKGLVLLASGLYEGVSLDEDAGRWQVICKVPYASLGEPGYKWMADGDPESYAWLAIRLLVQASGRISRSATDFGTTYILDSSFDRLKTNHWDLFPNFFREAVDVTKA